MPVTANSIITSQAPYASMIDFGARTACTTRAPTATAGLAAANIIEIVAASTNGREIKQINVKGSSSAFTAPTATQTITIWQWDGTTAFPVDEILTSVVTPSTTVASFEIDTYYIDWVLPAAHRLYASTSITTTAATTAFIIRTMGGDL